MAEIPLQKTHLKGSFPVFKSIRVYDIIKYQRCCPNYVSRLISIEHQRKYRQVILGFDS